MGRHKPIARLLVVMPSWLGDTVMAMPTLRALRDILPEAHISLLIRRNLRPLVDACPWVDRTLTFRLPKERHSGGSRSNMLRLARRIAKGKFDTAILLPNSFRTALLTCLAGIPRRVGYDRDGRGGLLTDCLLPRRQMGRYVAVSTREYYLGIARYLGAQDPSPQMQLFTRPDHDAQAAARLQQAGFDPASGRKLIILNPGANYGDAKMWMPQAFAQVGDQCIEQYGAAVAVSGSPKESGIVEQVISAAKQPMINLQAMGLNLSQLKSVIRSADLMVTNDTGPRHIAAAFDVPVVTIFGPTDPAWSEIDFLRERQVRVPVWCGPCQKKRCPLTGTKEEHQCMTLVTPQTVLEQVRVLLDESAAQTGAASA